MFLCLAMEEFKRKRRHGGFTPGKQASVYRIELDARGRAIWVMHKARIWWSAGYDEPEGTAIVKQGVAKHRQAYAELPWINTAAHRKLVTKTEAAKLLGKHWLPAAALDFITESVSEGVVQ